MQKYYDSVLLDTGAPAVGVSVLVTAFGGGAVTIYSDNGSTTRTNPITTDANGYFEFYAADGRYTLQISGTGITSRSITDILLEDPIDGSAAVFTTLTATTATITNLTTTSQTSLGGAANAESFRVSTAPVNTVNFIGAIGAIATATPAFSAQGADTNIGITYNAKGSAPHTFNNGNVLVNTVGSGLRVKEGSNAKQGTAVLVAGTSVVANTSVTASSRILLTSNVDGGTPGFLRVSARSAGVSFTITSSSGTDTSTVAYQIFEPA